PPAHARSLHDALPIYRDVVAGLSFSAARGELTAVLGPNGAGKTTTIECCEGLRRPDGGRIDVLGLDRSRADAAVELRHRVGVMRSEEHTSELQSRENL